MHIKQEEKIKYPTKFFFIPFTMFQNAESLPYSLAGIPVSALPGPPPSADEHFRPD